MYLTKIDPKTNLIDVSDVNDGVLSIKAFANLINDKKFGLEAMTCVALSVDYNSPMRKYPINERPLAAMRAVTGDTNTFPWNNDLIMEACSVYSDLQFNEDLEEIRILKNMRLTKLNELKEEEDFLKKQQVLNDLKRIKEMQQRYSDVDFNNLINESEAKSNGYKLSRLEQKLKNKKTFYHEQRKKQVVEEK